MMSNPMMYNMGMNKGQNVALPRPGNPGDAECEKYAKMMYNHINDIND